jgi:hypothetical protein
MSLCEIYSIIREKNADLTTTLSQQVGNLSSLTKKSRAETKLIAFTFKTKQKVSKKLF